MAKTFVGSRLRELRRKRRQTQAEMGRALGVSASYINLLENNQRSLSVPILMALADVYGVDWRAFAKDGTANLLADLRNAIRDPLFGEETPDLQELRAAIDHAPELVRRFLHLHNAHRNTLDRMMRLGSGRMPEDLVVTSPEAIIHDFFRTNSNHFDVLERAAEALRTAAPCAADDVYATLKRRLADTHGITVRTTHIEDLNDALRHYDEAAGVIHLSEALDHQNRVFQLAHVLCLLEIPKQIDKLTHKIGMTSQAGLARCKIELANYFAAAFLMPYEAFFEAAESTHYDVDRIAATFGVSFEQVCQRLTTLQRPGAAGVPFFFLRVDKAGNVTKRFNATSFNLAEYGGACPVWNIHTSFRTPGVIVPQFVELPEGGRFFTISRTTDRPVFSRQTQDRRLAIALGCEFGEAHRLAYAAQFNLADAGLFSPIGINCHVCPRQACSQRAHQPLHIELPISMNRRGGTRYES